MMEHLVNDNGEFGCGRSCPALREVNRARLVVIDCNESTLPQLIDYVLSRPLVSSAMIEKELKVATRGALNLVGELNLREVTGRGQYRAWGIV